MLQRVPAADIEHLRKWYELSQEDFARAVGVSRRAIIRWEQHEVSPSETARRSLELLWDIKQRLEPLYGQKAREWLHTPHRALRGNKPIAVLVTSGPVPVRDLVVGREAGGYR